MNLLALALVAATTYAHFTWYPDESKGTAQPLAPSAAVYSNPRAWSPDGQHLYFRKTHHPVANVLIENTSKQDGYETVNAYVTYLDAPGGAKDLGLRGGTKLFVPAGEKRQAVVRMEYIQFAEFDQALGKDKAAKGRYIVKFGPKPDDIRVTTDITLAEDFFFDEKHPQQILPEVPKFEGPHCIFKKTPNPCEDFLKPYYGKLSHEDYTLLDRAVRTFEWNALGKSCWQKIYFNTPPWGSLRAVNPSSAWFKGVWNWDSAFIMMATRRWDPELARDQMRLWMLMQNEEGCYPDSWTEGDGIQFAPEFANSKPPLFGWAMWQLHKTAPDRAFLREAYESLKRNVEWWRKNRLNEQYGLYHYDGRLDEPDDERRRHAGYESGWDDSPRWDGDAWHVLAIDLNAYLVLTYRALRDFAAELGYAEDHRLWTERGTALEQAMEKYFWDEEGQCYYDRNFVSGKFNRAISPASYMPLLIGTASQARADAMAKQAHRLEPGWPSAAYDDPQYDPLGYWRGRTWINVAYFALRGLALYGHHDIADRGKQTMFDWIRNDPSAIYETYNSRTGLPCGASHFSWSCTFVISFLLDWDLTRNQEMPAPFVSAAAGAACVGGCVSQEAADPNVVDPTRIGRKLGPIITDWEVREKVALRGQKRASFFIDDSIWTLRELARKRPKSIFDVPMFKMLKEAHDRYGLKVQMNLFYRTDYFYGIDEFTLAEVPSDYRAEFEKASDWLRFGLHALQEFPDYPFVNQEYRDLKVLADKTFGEIRRFAGPASCALAFEPHWSPINKDGCIALRDAGVKLLSTTHGERYEYVNASQLPYGHGMRVENNRKPDTAVFRRGYKAIDGSVCCYNHLTWEQYNATTGYFKAVYDRDTKFLYKKFCNTIFLNLYKPDEVERELAKAVGKDHIVFADHEQYFYPDYFAHQPYYSEMIMRAAKYVKEQGYSFIFLEDTVD